MRKMQNGNKWGEGAAGRQAGSNVITTQVVAGIIQQQHNVQSNNTVNNQLEQEPKMRQQAGGK